MKGSLSAGHSQRAQPASPWLVLAVLGMGGIASSLLVSSINVILPIVRADFGVDLSVVEWVITAHLLVSASLLIFFGRLGDIIGHKRIYTVGYMFFTLGCVLSALAPGIGYLIAGRVVQALATAMIGGVSVALLTTAFPSHKRGQALGLLAGSYYVGLSLGPIFGGFIVDWLGWPAVFWFLAVVGAICILLARLLLPDSVPGPRQGFDPAGAILFATGLSALLAALSQGTSWGWNSGLTLGLLALFAGTSALFVWVEGRVAAPMMNLAMFRNRTFSSGVVAAIVNYLVGSMIVFLMPFYLIELRGFAPGEAGLLISVQAVVMVAVAPTSGLLSDRFGARPLAAIGLVLQGCALLLIAQLGTEAPQWQISSLFALMGLGVGLFTSPNNSDIMGGASPEHQGVAAGLLAAARTIGMVLGVSVSSAIFRGLQTRSLAAGMTDSAAFVQAMSGALYTGAAFAALGVAVTLARGRTRRATPASGGPQT